MTMLIRNSAKEDGTAWTRGGAMQTQLQYLLFLPSNVVLDSEMASLIALEFDYEPHVDNSSVPLLFAQYTPIHPI